jgi:hypothetical protein
MTSDDLVRVAITGNVYFAPVGTELPTDVTTPLNAAFEAVGHVTADALTESYDVSTEILRSWQKRAGVRTVVTEVAWTWQMVLLETSPLVLELYYSGAQSTSSGGTSTTTVSADPEPVRKACVIEIEDGDVISRFALPVIEVGERGEVPHTSADGTGYDITINVFGDEDDLGYRITNDPLFASIASGTS